MFVPLYDKSQYIFQSKEWRLAQPDSTTLTWAYLALSPCSQQPSLFLSCVTFITSSHGTVRLTKATIPCNSVRVQLTVSLGITSCFPKSTTVCQSRLIPRCPMNCLSNTAFLLIFTPFPINSTLLFSFLLFSIPECILTCGKLWWKAVVLTISWKCALNLQYYD